MTPTRPQALLTRAEYLVIAISIPSMAIFTRLIIAVFSAIVDARPMQGELVNLSITVAMLVPFPLAVSAMVTAVATRRRSAEIVVLVVFSLIGALTSHCWRWVVAPCDCDQFWELAWIHARLYAPASGVFMSLTACFIAAIHQHRIAVAENARRVEAEAESARRTRQSIEQQMTPRLVVAVLQTVASRLTSDPGSAERLLLRLARHQRRLLQEAPADLEDEMRRVISAVAMIRPEIRVIIRGSGTRPGLEARHRFLVHFQHALLNCPPSEINVEMTASPSEVTVRFQTTGGEPLPASLHEAFANSGFRTENSGGGSLSVSLPFDAAPAPIVVEEKTVALIPSLPVVYPLLVYLVAIVWYSLSGSQWEQEHWDATVMTLASAACWLFIGPLLQRAILATVAFRLPLAIALASMGVLAATALATAVSAWFLYAIAADIAIFRNIGIMAWRNSLPALVIGASSLMTAYSGIMVAARAAAARAQNETVRAEARALEDRFHPHFLFNALNSIAAFIREDRAAAARMCLQLAGLVERTVAFAGERWWSVENEVELTAEYLSIQRTRFGDRLKVDQWEVPPDVYKRSIPRLVLQPLLENIFKHAVTSSAGPIHAGLKVRKRGRGIEILLWNSIAALAGPLEFGRGLAFVTGRVRDAEGTLTIDPGTSDGRFTIRCFIPPPL